MTKTKKVVFSAMFAALICVATMIIRIPTIGGYLNLGDCVVLLSGWVLGPAFGFCAAGIAKLFRPSAAVPAGKICRARTFR